MASAANAEQWPRISTVLPVRIDAILTISLYASLLSLGVSLMVPIKTKNKPKANESATRVTVLGEAILLPSVWSRCFPSDLSEKRTVSTERRVSQVGGGLLEGRQTWRNAGPQSTPHPGGNLSEDICLK